MDFSEANGEWQRIPPWVEFLIKFGFTWPSQASESRRIALISMPCDSPAAGLVALGAVIRDLGNARANNIEEHYDALLRYARQYLGSCQNCNLSTSDPQMKGCGYPAKATGRVRCTSQSGKIFQINDATDFEARQIAFERNGVITRPRPQFATEWYIDGEPPPIWTDTGGHLSEDFYGRILPGANILPENLGRSYSGLCLSGRALGEEFSREMCASVRFRSETGKYRLDQLLTVHEWSGSHISRLSFFNPRTERLDRNWSTPSLVIADGDVPFLKVFSSPQFRQSDIVGIVHRTMERDKLEAVGTKILPDQWYDYDEVLLREQPPIPRGISISILRRRD